MKYNTAQPDASSELDEVQAWYRSYATRVSQLKFGIFELLVQKETFADALLTDIVL